MTWIIKYVDNHSKFRYEVVIGVVEKRGTVESHERAPVIESQTYYEEFNMNAVARTLFRSFALSVRLYQRLFMRMHVWGHKDIPAGPNIYVCNHICDLDYLLLSLLPEATHFVIGPGYNLPLVGRLLDAFDQINATPKHRGTVVEKSVAHLKRGESVFICPEGELREVCRLYKFYRGVGRIYLASQAPMIPIGLVAPKRCFRSLPFKNEVDGQVYRARAIFRGPLCVNVGKPMRPRRPEGTDDEQAEIITELVRKEIESLIHDIRTNKFWM